MSLFKHRISRRVMLGGAGALLGLPALESLLPKKAIAADPPAKRFFTFYVPNGIVMNNWTPAETGAAWQPTPILASLAALKSKVSVLSGLANEPSRPEGPGDHAAGTSGFLTCRHVVKTEGADIKNGISVDQVAAATLKQFTKVPSLQLGTETGSNVGGCDSGYSCAYSSNISWASETQPMNKMVSPAVVFDLLFAGFDPSATAEQIARRKMYRKSILDYVLEDANKLNAKLSTKDRLKLEEYMTGVSELETQIAKPEGPVCETIPRPPDDPAFVDRVKHMLDLSALAFQCDSTRVISFMLNNAGSGRSYPFLGVDSAHHEISHHGGDATKIADLTKIDTWEVEQYAYLLGKMDAIIEADGTTMLDNSIVYFCSEIEDGDSHSHYNCPILLSGGAGGALNPGRHVVYNQDEPVANLFVAVLNALDVPTTSFGDDGTTALADV